MRGLVCDFCGGNLVISSGGNAICKNCGIEYDKKCIQEKIQKNLNIDNNTMINSSIKTDSDTIERWMDMAKFAMNAGNNQEAYDYFTRVIELDPNNWRAIFERGKAAAWQSTLANLRISELYEAISRCIDIIQKTGMEEQEFIKLSNEFAMYIFDINNAVTDLVKRNFLDIQMNDLYFDLNWDDMWQERQQCLNNIEFMEVAMSFIDNFEDTLSKSNIIKIKKRMCLDLSSACDHVCYWTDYSKENLACFGFSAEEKRIYIEKYADLLKDIRKIEPGYLTEKNSYLLDPFSPSLRYDPSRNIKIFNYWKNRFKKEEIEERRREYWEIHFDEKEQLENEKNDLYKEINLLDTNINDLLSNIEKDNIQQEINKLINEQKQLGIFKIKDKKRLDEKINALKGKIDIISENINSQVREIEIEKSKLSQRIKDIDYELNKDR